MKNLIAWLFVVAFLAACAVPYVEPFSVDAGTSHWRDRAVRGL